MEHGVELHASRCSAGNRRQQGATKRVTERVAKARVERSNAKGLAIVDLVAEGFDGRSLDNQHMGLLGVCKKIGYLEYNSTMSCSWIDSSICSRWGTTRTVTLKPLSPFSSQPGTVRSNTSRLRLTLKFSRVTAFKDTTSPGRTRYEGMSTRLPLTLTCPWRTSWRA